MPPMLSTASLAAGLAVALTATLAAATRLPDFDKLWNYDDPAATETKFREILPAARKAEDVAYHAELLSQIARTYSLRGKFDEAHRLLDQVEGMLKPGMDRARVRYLLERGRSFNSADKPEEALPLFTRAWDLARKAREDRLAVDAAHMIAIAYRKDPAKALKWNLVALDYAEKSDQPAARKWLGSLYNNIGWTYHDMGSHEKALATFEKGLAWRKGQGKDADTRIARYSVARALRSLGRHDAALAIQRTVAADFEAKGEADGFVFEEIAENLLAQGQATEARPWFSRAHAELSKDDWLISHEPERLKRLESLARAATASPP